MYVVGYLKKLVILNYKILKMQHAYSLTRVDATTTDENWQQYFQLRTQAAKTLKEHFFFTSWQDLKDKSVNFFKDNTLTYIVRQDQKEVGYFNFFLGDSIPLKAQYTFLRVYLLEGNLNEDLLKMILPEFLDFKEHSQYLLFQSKNGIYDTITKTLSPTITCSFAALELDTKKANNELMKSWLAEYPAQFSNYTLQFYKDIPDDLLEEYSAVYTEILQDVPGESLEARTLSIEQIKQEQKNNKFHNYYNYHYLLFNETNKLVGITKLLINDKNTQAVRQQMTGVLKEYRRQGLAKWLKAAMFEKLEQDFPNMQKITTDTTTENIASRNLNKSVGFQEVNQTKEFLIPKEMVLSFLGLL